MTALAQAYEVIAHAAGHVLAVPLSIAVLALLWLFLPGSTSLTSVSASSVSAAAVCPPVFNLKTTGMGIAISSEA